MIEASRVCNGSRGAGHGGRAGGTGISSEREALRSIKKSVPAFQLSDLSRCQKIFRPPKTRSERERHIVNLPSNSGKSHAAGEHETLNTSEHDCMARPSESGAR